MTQALHERFRSVRVSNAGQAGALQVFGLNWDCPSGLAYTTLDEALARKTLEVSEVHQAGSVPLLKVVNREDAPVFLMAGEHLIGAKQNRVLNSSILVPPRSELPIPVSCVEAGRWSHQSQPCTSAGTLSYGQLRRVQAKGIAANYRRGADAPVSNQQEVWAEVDRKLKALGGFSPSNALHQAYVDHEYTLHEYSAQLPAPPDCQGAVFAVRGQIAGADLFDKPSTLAKLWCKLVRAFALDALEAIASPDKRLAADAVSAWLKQVVGAREQAFKPPGLGYDVRLEARHVLGAGLVVDEQPVHVELFPRDEPADAPQKWWSRWFMRKGWRQ
jgi:hypothetical protein